MELEPFMGSRWNMWGHYSSGWIVLPLLLERPSLLDRDCGGHSKSSPCWLVDWAPVI